MAAQNTPSVEFAEQTIDEQLRVAAVRILNDGEQHAPAAIGWAIEQLAPVREWLDAAQNPSFTDRELSLGASPWW